MTDTSFLSSITGLGIPATKGVPITDINSQQDVLDLKRKQALAGLLLQQSQQPDNSPSQIGGYYVRKSPFLALAKAAQMMMGVKMGAEAEAKGVQLQKDALGRLLGAAGAGGASSAPAPSGDAASLGTQVQANEQSGLPWQTGQAIPVSPAAPTSSPMQGAPAPLAVQNMTPEQRAILLQIAPEKYMDAFAAQFAPTDTQKNNQYMGINPAQARTLHLASQAKDIGVAGALPNLDQAGNISIAPIPGAIGAQAAMSGAIKGAEQKNTILPNISVDGIERPVWGSDIPRIGASGSSSKPALPTEAIPSVPLPAPKIGKNIEIEQANADFMKQQGKALIDERPNMVQSAEGINNIRKMKDFINSPSFNGKLADNKLQVAKTFKTLGLLPPQFDEKIANTEAFSSLGAREVGNVIKAFGSGTGISDADRDYAEKLAGGKISLDKESINRILDISNKVNLNKLNDFNQRVKQGAQNGMKGFYGLEVEVPEVTPPPSQSFEATKTIGAKTYVKQNGKWFEQ